MFDSNRMINWKSGQSGLSQWDVCVQTNSGPVQAERDISFDRQSWCGASFDLVWGCPRDIAAVDRCGGGGSPDLLCRQGQLLVNMLGLSGQFCFPFDHL